MVDWERGEDLLEVDHAVVITAFAAVRVKLDRGKP